MREEIPCEACAERGFKNNRFKAITFRHLQTHHNMTLDEYVERWPDAPLRGKDDKWVRKTDVEIPEDITRLMGELRPVQQQYVIARVKGMNKATAARVVDLAPSTVYTWKDLPLIERLIACIELEPTRQAQMIIQTALPKAARTMLDLTDSSDDSIAQRASADLMDRGGLSRKPSVKIDLDFHLWTNEELDSDITKRLQEMGEIVEAEFEEIG